MAAGGSAHSRAAELRAQATQARARADVLEAEAGAWSAGAEGERRVAATLGQLPPGWYVHHDRLLRPGRGGTNLDHVVIGPSGVYLVDTKNWAGGTSVHGGILWQHTGSSSPKGREPDNVARFAGEMEKGLGLPVVPVIALAGSRASSFARQRVRGVEIIPHEGLVAWLLAQPATSDAMGAELLSRRVAHTYPPASPEETRGADGAGWTVADVLGTRRSAVRTTPPVGRTTIKRVPPRRTARRPRRRRGSRVSALVGLLALLALSQLGPRIVPAVLGPAMRATPAPGHGLLSPSTGSKPCHSLTKGMVQNISGASVVTEKPTADPDTCTWWLATPRYTTQAADVTVKTGAGASISFAATGTTRARIDMTAGEVSAWLPRSTRLEGWKADARASQPFIVTLHFAHPPGADNGTTSALEAASQKKVSRLAEALSVALAR